MELQTLTFLVVGGLVGDHFHLVSGAAHDVDATVDVADADAPAVVDLEIEGFFFRHVGQGRARQ